MSFITDPTGSIYATKVNWRERPAVRTVNQWVSAEDMNQVRSALIEVRDLAVASTGASSGVAYLTSSIFTPNSQSFTISGSLTASAMLISSSATGTGSLKLINPSGSTVIQQGFSPGGTPEGYPSLVMIPSSSLGFGQRVAISGARVWTAITADDDQITAGIETHGDQNINLGFDARAPSGSTVHMTTTETAAEGGALLYMAGFASSGGNRELVMRAGRNALGFSFTGSSIHSSHRLQISSLASGTDFSGTVSVSGILKFADQSGSTTIRQDFDQANSFTRLLLVPSSSLGFGQRVVVSGNQTMTALTVDSPGGGQPPGVEVRGPVGIAIGFTSLVPSGTARMLTQGGAPQGIARVNLISVSSSGISAQLDMVAGLDAAGVFFDGASIATTRRLQISSTLGTDIAGAVLFSGALTASSALISSSVIGSGALRLIDPAGSTIIKQGIDPITSIYPAMVITPSAPLGFGERIVVSGTKTATAITTDNNNRNAGIEVNANEDNIPSGISAVGRSGTFVQVAVVESAPQGYAELNLVSSTGTGLTPTLTIRAGLDTNGAFFDGASIDSSRVLQVKSLSGTQFTGSVSLSSVLGLASFSNSSPVDGHVWRSGSDILYRNGATTVKLLTGSYP